MTKRSRGQRAREHRGARSRLEAVAPDRSDGAVIDHRLPSGARILVQPSANAPSHAGPAAIQLWVLAGTSAEHDDEHGCAHLLEHMLFKPTARADGSVRDIASAIEDLGGDVNAFTSHDETCFHATLPSRSIDEGLEALVGPVVRPQFDPDELGREVRVVVEEIKQYEDDPSGRAVTDMLERLYGGHGYGRPVLGRRKEVLSHTAERLRAFHREVYSADRTVLVVTGSVDPDRVIEQGTALLQRLPKRGRSIDEGAPSVPEEPQVYLRRDEVQESHIAFGWQTPPLSELDGCALEIASVVLGYGDASRLETQTRRRDRLVTDAHASSYAARLGSSFVVTANVAPAGTAAAVEGLFREVDQLRRVPIEQEELRRATAVLRSDIVYRRETVQGMAHALGYQLSLTGDLRAEARYFAMLDAVTPEQVQQACARHLQARNVSISIVTPKKFEQAPLRAAIKRVLTQGELERSPLRRGRARVDRRGIASVDLGNGLRIRAMIDRSVPMAAGWLVWPGGLRYERARSLGAGAMMATLLNRGCEGIRGDALAREIDGRAAVLEGFAGRNSLGIHFEGLAEDASLLLRRALQCAIAPTFDEEELDEERRVALEDLAAEQDDPGGLAFRAALGELYRGHPFRWRRRGTKETLQSLTSAGLRRRWHEDYPLGRAVLGLAGDVELDSLVGLVDALVPAAEPVDPRPLPGGPPRYPKRPQSLRIRRARAQAHLVLAFPGLAMADPRVFAMDVLTAVLGGQVGRLFNALREKRGLVYHVAAASHEGIDAGHVSVYAATSHRRADQARKAIDEELARMIAEPVSVAELDRAKAYLIGQWEVGVQRRSRRASSLAFDEVYALGRGAFLDYPERVASVTAKEVLALGAEVLDPRGCVEALVSG